VIDFPDGWGSAPPVDQRVHTKGDLVLFGCLLEDGSNLFALIYPGGYRFARTAHAIDWGIQEVYGPPPRRRDAARVNATWRDTVLAEMIAAGKAADAVYRAAGLPPAREVARRLRAEGWE
jgi:hypothetical protein